MLEIFFTETISHAINNKSILTILVIFLGGVITSISPCVLSMLPLLVGYVSSCSDNVSKKKGFVLSTTFVLGLSTTFAILGIIATSLGLIFGQVSSVWYYILATVAIIMGLNILGVIHLKIPGLKRMPVKLRGYPGAYLMGLSFGLVASTCATPVLAVIITYVATQGNLLYGILLLFMYGVGHGLPLILAGTFTGLLKSLPKIQKYNIYINYFSGGILILMGLLILMWIRW